MDRFRILVADDDEDDFYTLYDAFIDLNEGHTLEYAGNGQKVISFLRETLLKLEELPNIILLDINMPKMDGFETLDALKNTTEYKDIPVIVYSTCNDMDQMKKCYKLGADGFVTKGCSYKVVLSFARSVIDFLNGHKQISGIIQKNKLTIKASN